MHTRRLLLCLLGLTVISQVLAIAKPTLQQIQWQNYEIGSMISFNMWTFDTNNSVGNPPPIDVFNPTELNTDAWLEASAAFQAKYAVLTAKHSSGFCLWPTEYPGYNYSVKYTKWGNGQRDIVREFVNSCKKYNIKPAFYYSISNNYYQDVVNGKPQTNGTDDWSNYNKLCLAQLTELWTQYGDLAEIWFDGGLIPPSQGGPDVLPLLQKYQPNALAFNAPLNYSQCIRWAGNEGGYASDPNWSTCTDIECAQGGAGDPNGYNWCPTEVDTPLRDNGRHDWFWLPDGGRFVKTIDQLFYEYKVSVGRNANYLLNINPNQQGLIDQIDMERYQEFGVVLSTLSKKNAIAATNGNGLEVTLDLKQSTWIDHIVIQEDISYGEFVRLYAVEGQDPVTGLWSIISNGTAIGHKKIDFFSPIAVNKLTFVALQAADTPRISFFGAYFIGQP